MLWPGRRTFEKGMHLMAENQAAQRVIITGGHSGIGLATARAFVQAGARVAIIGRREAVLRSAAAGLGERALWQQADVSRREQIGAAVEAIVAEFGGVDVLVNSAGTSAGPAIRTSDAIDAAERAWDEEIAIHLTGVFLTTMAVAPHLTRPGGRIISISSIAAYSGGSRAGSIGYAAAKAGVIGLTLALARELSPQGITVNAIAPGFVADTGFTGAWPAERVQSLIATIPVGRAGASEDIAAAVLYLASPCAAFVTGTVLHVNGGALFHT
jgi:3-oxoacyl-[acyl-carrier protein] reductase